MKKSYKTHTRRGGRADLPKLVSARELALLLTRETGKVHSRQWVMEAWKDGRIPAGQAVGGHMVVFPVDCLIRPRYVELENRLLDAVLPEWRTKGIEPALTPPKNGFRGGALFPGDEGRNQKTVRVPALKRLRVERNLSARQLARKAHVGGQTIGRAEEGGKVVPRTVLKLAEALGVDYPELMRERLEVE